jgi:SAM-dependent methyltransferase/uncharacterized protein YbaR (Trm112 family)
MNEIETGIKLKLKPSTQKLLQCPACTSQLEADNNSLKCKSSQCKTVFPIINEIPILINDSSSVFSINQFLDSNNTILKPKSRIERFLVNLVPRIILNVKGKENYKKFTELLLKENDNPRILIIGSSVVGEGIEPLLSAPSIEIIESDVAFGSTISLICDAHDIPFANNSFDGVVVQAVLEHVVDPYRCVEEIYRVLKKNGLVYSETPFIQQVHLGKYDFTRFTYLGHRRLFRKFEEISSGAVCGPGMALAWSYQYFLLSFVKASIPRAIVKVFARVTSFWLLYFDYYLINKPGTFDSASGYHFLGKKSEKVLDDRKLITLYKGTQQSSF